MDRRIVFSLGTLALAACAASPATTTRAPSTKSELRARVSAARTGTEKRAFEIADFYRCATVSAPAVSSDGSRLAFSVKRYDLERGATWSEIWMMKSDGSELRQMTAGEHDDNTPEFSPDGRELVFVSDRSASPQLWVMSVEGGEPRQLTKFAPGVGSPEWSPDGRYLAVTADVYPSCGLDEECHTRIATGRDEGKLKVHVADELLYRHWSSWRDGLRTHIFLVDAETGKVVKDMTPGDFDSPTFSLGGRGFAFSPDGKELCYVSNHDADQASSTNADLWIVPVDGAITDASAKNITLRNRGWDSEPIYSPDGRFLAYVSQKTPGYESDLKQLVVYDREKRASRALTDRASFDDWVDDMRWTSDSKALVFQAEHRGRTPLFRVDLAGGAPQKILEHALLAGFELSKDDARVFYTRRSIHEPTEVFVRPLAAETPARLTTFNGKIESEVDIRPPQEMWIAGDGDYEVHCFVVTPHGFDPAQKYPLVLNVHGGPQSQWQDAFRGDWQVYPGKGYIVAFCNPTGSTGYGQAFTDAITGDWGGRVYRDLMKVTDALEELPYVDKDRIGVMGWSYGGYMTMWMQGHTTRYRCTASMMGVYDLEAEYGATEELWFPEHDFRGTPWTSDDYEKWSPSNFVKSFKTPALVITGEKDYRVPYAQSLAYHTALVKMGVPARLVVYPNAGHWPSWYEMAFYYNAHLDFFHRWLGGGEAPWSVEDLANNLVFEEQRARAAE